MTSNAQPRRYAPRPWQYLYRTSRWRTERVEFLTRNPMCVYCRDLANVVDHKTPHKGDEALFWDQTNWQPCCKPCHDGTKKQLEMSGTIKGSDVTGAPIDPNHHWNLEKG